MNTSAIKQISTIVGSFVALATIGVSLTQFISARNQANRIAAYEHHQKALQLIYAPNRPGALHVGAIYTLSTLAIEVPTTEISIANELAVAALDYATDPDKLLIDTPKVPPISNESQAALQVIGGLLVMAGGLPLHLAHGYFHGASLPKLQLNGVELWGSDLSGSDFYNTSLYGADLRFSRLNGASFPGAILTNAGFHGALLCPGFNTVISAQNTGIMVPVSLSGAKMDHADFEYAWLIEANFDSDSHRPANERTYLFHASFKGADLESASFQYAKLDFADFSGANLTDANFTNASGISTVTVDENTRLCRTKGLKIPNVVDDCAPPRSATAPRCVLYKTWRELDRR